MTTSDELSTLRKIIALAASLAALEVDETPIQTAAELARQNELLREEVKRFVATIRAA